MITFKSKKIRASFWKLVCFFLLVPWIAGAQTDMTFDTTVSLFNSKNFEQALPGFKSLHEKDTTDAMLNYYYGASMIEQGIFTEEAGTCLMRALTGNTPDKIYYYVGRFFENQGQWNSALKYYNRFKNFGSEEEKTATGILDRIDFCYAQANQGNVTRPDTLVILKPENESKAQEIIPDQVVQVTDTTPAPATVQAPTGLMPVAPQKANIPQFSFQINSEIEYVIPEHFKNPEALEAFTEGSQAESRLKEILAESDSLRNAYEKSVAERDSIAQKILSIEQESVELKNLSETLFAKARALEQEYWKNVDEVEAGKFRNEVEALKKSAEAKPEKEILPEEALLILTGDEPDLAEPVTEPETAAPKPAEEIVFKIQLGTYKVVPAASKKMLDKLALLREVEHFTDEKGMTIYTTGNLTNFDDAVKMQNQVRQEGVKDAFVAAYRNGKRININEARELTKKK